MFNLSKIIVTLFYVGFSKYFPGTISSIISFSVLSIAYISLSLFYLSILFIIILFLSLHLINIYQKNIGKNDPSEIVVDEFLGVFFIILCFNLFDKLNIYVFCLLGFILFRIFDILKPFPINWIDKEIKNSFGVIFDDIVAGVYTIVCLKIINEFIF